MSIYARTLEELREKAVLFWPKELLEREAILSILPLLLKTQDKFIGLLTIADSGPEAWLNFVNQIDEMRGNVFLKHLMVLTDIAGEALNKMTPLSRYFKDGSMRYIWHENEYTYKFRVLQNKVPLANSALQVDAKAITTGFDLNNKMTDVCMLLIHGAAAIGDTLPDDFKEKCVVGSLLGDAEQVKSFVRQNYIRVSTQLRGATSNALGHIAQNYARDILQKELPDWSIASGRIPGISHDDGNTETAFDIVARSPNQRYFAIEVSFQFTTNSVIERKAGQAQARARLLHDAGHHICYVVDGAGNINVRERAVRIICQYSDCTVAFSANEISHLAHYLRETSNVPLA